jgi:ribose transport system substrate-binding protein
MIMDEQKNRYVIRSIEHAAQLLSAFKSPGEALRLPEIAERTGFNRGMCFRLAFTLHRCGFLEKVSNSQYRLVSERQPQRRFRIAFSYDGQDSSFVREVLASVALAAKQASVELITVENRSHSKLALRNAEQLIRDQVDLVIELQTNRMVDADVADVYLMRGIPLIAADIPHQGAIYFGANNYQAGLIAGRHLGRWAKTHWGGQPDQLLLLDISRGGPAVQTRVRGMIKGVKEELGDKEDVPVSTLDGDAAFKASLNVVRRWLRGTPPRRVLIGAANDPSALGALRAFEEAGRASHCAVVGQSAEPEARAELREPRTRLIGSVAYFPERYGDGLIRLALDILSHKPVSAGCFVHHQIITPENVDHFYPNDTLLVAS